MGFDVREIEKHLNGILFLREGCSTMCYNNVDYHRPLWLSRSFPGVNGWAEERMGKWRFSAAEKNRNDLSAGLPSLLIHERSVKSTVCARTRCDDGAGRPEVVVLPFISSHCERDFRGVSEYDTVTRVTQ